MPAAAAGALASCCMCPPAEHALRAVNFIALLPSSASLPTAAASQQSEAEEAAELAATAAANGAAAATTLSGMAVKLSGSDAFLSAVEGAEGPLAAYREGRLKGMYRKVGAPSTAWPACRCCWEWCRRLKCSYACCLRLKCSAVGTDSCLMQGCIHSPLRACILLHLDYCAAVLLLLLLLMLQDERQELTMARIQRLYEELRERLGGGRSLQRGQGLTLVDAAPASSSSSGSSSGSGGSSWFSSWFGSREESAAAAQPVRGLYMYGGVGVGKTMLMDLLAQEAPPYFQVQGVGLCWGMLLRCCAACSATAACRQQSAHTPVAPAMPHHPAADAPPGCLPTHSHQYVAMLLPFLPACPARSWSAHTSMTS
jgi:hypothetical protein